MDFADGLGFDADEHTPECPHGEHDHFIEMFHAWRCPIYGMPEFFAILMSRTTTN